MSDTTELLLVLLVVYLIECVVPVRPDGLAFIAWWPGRFRATPPFSLRGSRTLAVGISPPWPPLSPAIVAEPWPLELDPDGVSDGERRLPWRDVTSVAAEGRLVLVTAGAVSLVGRAGSEGAATEFASLVESARAENARGAAISASLERAIEARFDVASARVRLAAVARRVWVCRVAGSLQLVTLGVGVPFAVHGDVRFSGWIVLALGLAAWWSAAGVTLWSSRALGLSVSQRIGLVLSPLSAIRAGDHFHRQAIGRLDPVAAALLSRSPDAPDVARRALADWTLRESVAERWLPARLAEAAQRCLEREGVEVRALFVEPDPDGPASVRYCPRCLGQLVVAAPHCPTCGDVPTRPITRS